MYVSRRSRSQCRGGNRPSSVARARPIRACDRRPPSGGAASVSHGERVTCSHLVLEPERPRRAAGERPPPSGGAASKYSKKEKYWDVRRRGGVLAVGIARGRPRRHGGLVGRGFGCAVVFDGAQYGGGQRRACCSGVCLAELPHARGSVGGSAVVAGRLPRRRGAGGDGEAREREKNAGARSTNVSSGTMVRFCWLVGWAMSEQLCPAGSSLALSLSLTHTHSPSLLCVLVRPARTQPPHATAASRIQATRAERRCVLPACCCVSLGAGWFFGWRVFLSGCG